MDLRKLRYFVAIAEELHFGRAAKRLAISQPPLSQALRQLEEEIGGPLFERNNRGVALTAAGVVLQREATKLLKHAGDVEEIAARAVRGMTGRIRIGFVGAMLFRGFMGGIRAFQDETPNIETTLLELNTEEQIKAVERDQLDVGFIHSGALGPDVAHRRLMSEPFLCCMADHHPRAGDAAVSIADLREETFILFPRALSPHYHDRIVAICITAGFSPRIPHEVRHWQTIVRMVREGLGISLVPASLTRAGVEGVRFRPLREVTVHSETIAIWRREGAAPSVARLIACVGENLPIRGEGDGGRAGRSGLVRG